MDFRINQALIIAFTKNGNHQRTIFLRQRFGEEWVINHKKFSVSHKQIF
jgi:hypothetical protein